MMKKPWVCLMPGENPEVNDFKRILEEWCRLLCLDHDELVSEELWWEDPD
jgi:hypothetical protein